MGRRDFAQKHDGIGMHMIDIDKLDITKTVDKPDGPAIIARCPACAEDGADDKGEHLIVFDDGRFGCVVYPRGDDESEEHRSRILELVGIDGWRPKKQKRKRKAPAIRYRTRFL